LVIFPIRLRSAPPTRVLGSSAVVVKIVTFFLIGMAILAMFGKLRVPGASLLASKKCKRCGRHKIGKGPCECGARK